MAVAKKAENTGSKGGFLDRLKNPGKRFGFFREVWLELKKVHWPTRQTLLTYTGVVLVSVIIVAILVWIVDSGLTFAMDHLLSL
ncbi:preprotein translocase subunit SecE [Dehalobacter sp. DCM]|uniref:preprotein translocase subunit SecE n=1 Tax=Dehalobacter sp. DCM TaxID=2907827 RepID=UPI003081C1C0|nr:preprotein translocase subunit SecE [Dehalobacter sp. DCM]